MSLFYELVKPYYPPTVSLGDVAATSIDLLLTYSHGKV